MVSERIILQRLADTLDKAIQKEFTLQGHSLTGAAERSISGTFKELRNRSEMVGTALEYMATLDDGLLPSEYKARYFGSAAHLKDLAKFVTLRTGVTGDNALKAAYAIYRSHLREGMPTLGSYRFSETGERTGFLEAAEARSRAVMDDLINDGLDEYVDQEYTKQKSERI